MKFLKQIFGLNGRLDRKGYLFFGVLPMVLLILLLKNVHFFVLEVVALILFIPIFILALISAVKRGRDSGMNGLVTLFLFGVVPILTIVFSLQFKIYIIYMAFSFIAYLLLMPSSSKELKSVGKVEHLFTLIAIILVYPLLLLGLIAPKVTSCEDGQLKADLICVNMRGTENALKMFKLDNGAYPTTEEGLNALVSNPNLLRYLNYAVDGYLEKIPKDIWGTPIIYVKTKNGFELISYGADRKEGGEDGGDDILYSECEGR